MPIISAISPTSSFTPATSSFTAATSSTTASISPLSSSFVRPICSNIASSVRPRSVVSLSIAACSASSRVAPASSSAYIPVASLDSSASVFGSSSTDGEPMMLLMTLNVAVGMYVRSSSNLAASKPSTPPSDSGSNCPTKRSTSSCVTSTRPSSS